MLAYLRNLAAPTCLIAARVKSRRSCLHISSL